ncbi:MAG: sigma-70 family RNA polymerase sigma factor [Gemmatimonadetes bacterium]|nr:sigma-70 family RNA polymerase sigma factor [Gemmatimonadota bacterium]
MNAESKRIKDCLAGVPGAWEEMIKVYGNLVYSVPRNLGLDEDAIEDICQIVWTAVVTQLSRLEDHGRFRSWLLSITYRQSKGYVKRMIRERPADLEDFTDHPDLVDEVSMARFIEDLERQRLVVICLEYLDDACRSLLSALYLSDDSSYSTISSQLSIPVGSIGPTRARCLLKLRQFLRRQGLGMEDV